MIFGMDTGGILMQKPKYLVIGGDMRNFYLAELLKKEYHRVEIYGFDPDDNRL